MSDPDDAERIFCEALEVPTAEKSELSRSGMRRKCRFAPLRRRLLSENDALGSFLNAPVVRLELPTAPLPSLFVRGNSWPLLNC